jgi:hypothetical protein
MFRLRTFADPYHYPCSIAIPPAVRKSSRDLVRARCQTLQPKLLCIPLQLRITRVLTEQLCTTGKLDRTVIDLAPNENASRSGEKEPGGCIPPRQLQSRIATIHSMKEAANVFDPIW